MASGDSGAVGAGPVLFAYDGSDLAKLAIEQAGRQLVPGRDALVVCVWQPGDVGFLPPGGGHLKANDAAAVRTAAEATARQGASLASGVGFQPRSLAIEAAPTWRGIISAAAGCEASLIVLGAHRRTGLAGHLLGSVSDAVVAHADAALLIVHL
jgi:nucleotide-binding universal stress UspA family protein